MCEDCGCMEGNARAYFDAHGHGDSDEHVHTHLEAGQAGTHVHIHIHISVIANTVVVEYRLNVSRYSGYLSAICQIDETVHANIVVI